MGSGLGREDEALSLSLLGNSTYNTVDKHILYSYSICCFDVCISAPSGGSATVMFVCMFFFLHSHIYGVCVLLAESKGGHLEFSVFKTC